MLIINNNFVIKIIFITYLIKNIQLCNSEKISNICDRYNIKRDSFENCTNHMNDQLRDAQHTNGFKCVRLSTPRLDMRENAELCLRYFITSEQCQFSGYLNLIDASNLDIIYRIELLSLTVGKWSTFCKQFDYVAENVKVMKEKPSNGWVIEAFN